MSLRLSTCLAFRAGVLIVTTATRSRPDRSGLPTAENRKRFGVIVGQEPRGEVTVLQAQAPLAAMFGYSTQVRSLSQGRAGYSMEPLKYEPAPPSVMKEMLGE